METCQSGLTYLFAKEAGALNPLDGSNPSVSAKKYNKPMKTKLSLISSSLVGIVFGILSNYSILSGSWIDLVLGTIIGLLIGLFIENKIFIKWSGIFYGFFLTLFFLISGFQGDSNKIIIFILFSIFLSIIGAFCGWCLVFTGNWVKTKLR